MTLSSENRQKKTENLKIKLPSFLQERQLPSTHAIQKTGRSLDTFRWNFLSHNAGWRSKFCSTLWHNLRTLKIMPMEIGDFQNIWFVGDCPFPKWTFLALIHRPFRGVMVGGDRKIAEVAWIALILPALVDYAWRRCSVLFQLLLEMSLKGILSAQSITKELSSTHPLVSLYLSSPFCKKALFINKLNLVMDHEPNQWKKHKFKPLHISW